MKQLNWNASVKVKLNDRGKDIYYRQYDKLNEMLAKKGYEGLATRYPDVDEKGYSEFPLWNFMKTYGLYIGMGMPEIVDDINFYIEDDALMEVKL